MRLNKKYLLFLAAASVLIFAFAKAVPADNELNRESLLIEAVMQSLASSHYKALPIDDAFSEKVFDTYLKRMDSGKRFFLKEDVESFKEHRLRLDDYAKNHNFEFIDAMNGIKGIRVKQASAFYEEILSTPFDFEKKESIETDPDKVKYAKDESELKKRWQQLLKYSVMVDLDTKIQRQKKAEEESDTSIVIKPFAELEIDARAKVLKDYNRWFKNISQETRDDNIALYINSFVAVTGPHTSYFPPIEKENFDIRMSGKLEGIGATLTPKDGYINVTRIVAGSASWKQGQLAVNDLIMKVGQGNEEPLNIVDMKLTDVVQLIRGKKGTEVRLTVKKEDGSIVTIPIIRDIVILEESYAKSAVINEEDAKEKIGIVDLRSFYADFNDASGRRSSSDVKKEVEKLIADNVDGIIIDLRFNGGGSLSDAVDMTGLFIEKGPVVQVEASHQAPVSLDDDNPSVLYDGPLVILVNSFSASASEIMAAALQDYGRAVIIGSAPSTFGKGTVQRFFDMDRMVTSQYADLGKLGNIKITTQKFFRINGGSTQLKGVTPDIVLPGLYSYINAGEKDEDFPLEWTEIAPSSYEQSSIKKLSTLKKKSAARVADNEALSIIDGRAKWVKEQRDITLVSLNLADYQKKQEINRQKSEEYEAVVDENQQLSINFTSMDLTALVGDTARISSMESWHKSLKKDPYLMEAVEVLGDMD
ncbi:MAG: carboxyl-terminal processing protease [Flavobacteriaceae bacterium]|jgi:carboxyl-terminal processing protease